jgi:hypothetical protein
MVVMMPQVILGQQGNLPVAVINFEISGTDSVTPAVVTNRFRAELLKYGVFDVLERDRMDEILTEQGFQQTGVCNSDQCIVEAGRLLGVTSMIGGVVGKVGSLYSISARLIDVQTGRIQYMVTGDYEDDLENLVTKAIPDMAEKFSNRALSYAGSLTGYGTVRLDSEPQGARIYIDGKPSAAVTPAVIDSLEAGVHVIRLQKEMYYATKTVFVAPEEYSDVALTLTLSRGALKVITEPTGADIYIDFDYAGQSPNIFSEKAVGSYVVKIMKKGYVEFNQIITIRENETTILTASLRQMTRLTVTSEPVESVVFLDDSLIGRTPLSASEISPGFHKLRLTRDGYVDYVRTLSFMPGKDTTLNIQMIAAAGLNVRTEPQGAHIYVNGVFRGVSPVDISGLIPGNVEIKAKLEAYDDEISRITLDGGAVRQLRFDLKRKRGTLKILSLPSQAVVEIDGRVAGKTPFVTDSIAFGKHLVRLTSRGYLDIEKSIEIRDALPKTIRVNFEIANGTLYLNASPKDAVIHIDNKRIDGISPEGIRLLPGKYVVRASRAGYEKFNTLAIVRAQDALSMHIDMVRKSRQKALLRSAIFPGWGQHYSEKHVLGNIFMLSEIVALAGIMISDLVYDHRISDYHDVRKEYENAITLEGIEHYRNRMNDQYSKVENARDVREKFIYASIGIWMLNILDSALLSPVYPRVSGDQLGLTLKLRF